MDLGFTKTTHSVLVLNRALLARVYRRIRGGDLPRGETERKETNKNRSTNSVITKRCGVSAGGTGEATAWELVCIKLQKAQSSWLSIGLCR